MTTVKTKGERALNFLMTVAYSIELFEITGWSIAETIVSEAWGGIGKPLAADHGPAVQAAYRSGSRRVIHSKMEQQG